MPVWNTMVFDIFPVAGGAIPQWRVGTEAIGHPPQHCFEALGMALAQNLQYLRMALLRNEWPVVWVECPRLDQMLYRGKKRSPTQTLIERFQPRWEVDTRDDVLGSK